MAILWTEDMTTGSAEIDRQHKEIFLRINWLLDACNLGKGKAEVGTVINFLDDYVATHFSLEEAYMRKYRYRGYAEHKAKHEEFIKNFLTLKKQVETEGPGVHTVIATNRLVVNWFVNHIRKVDTQLGAFLKERPERL